MAVHKRARARPPMTEEMLGELALAYVGRFATTRARLASYLKRNIRERGWAGASDPPIDTLVGRFARSGLVDDAAYALSKSRSLAERGYGAGRLRHSLLAAGVEEADWAAARELADDQAVEAALRFARRRRIGPFAEQRPDPRAREKALAAMIRAGHSFELARALVDCRPGEEPDLEELRHK